MVDTYYQTAGTTKYTQIAAARQAAQDMFNVTTGLRGGPAWADITALYNDFATMQSTLQYGTGQRYSELQAQTDADAKTLHRVCGAS